MEHYGKRSSDQAGQLIISYQRKFKICKGPVGTCTLGYTSVCYSGTDGLERSTVCVYIPYVVNIPISKYTLDK